MTAAAQHNLTVIWHDVECGGYGEDLPVWRVLASAASGPIVELGCGTGRVALDLAGQGHRVTAVDRDEELLSALRRRAAERGLEVDARVGDVSALDLGREFALALAPMQVIQLLSEDERRLMLAATASALMPGGLLAVSIVEGVPAGGGDLSALPDVAEIDGIVYSSLPLEIFDRGERMAVTRLRQIVTPAGDLTETVDETTLAALDAGQLEAEAGTAGFRPHGRREIPTTEDHVGSTVVLLEAP